MNGVFSFGGAAGNCPPVRKVTNYSSTYIVSFESFTAPQTIEETKKSLGRIAKD